EIPYMTYVKIAEPFRKQVRDMIHRAYSEGYKQGKFDAEKERYEPTDDILFFSDQQVRDRIIEQEKKYIENLEKDFNGRDKYHVNIYMCDAEFVVNREKRTVVALLVHRFDGSKRQPVIARGIAKCAPDDCFNVHIGKVIALRRALGLEVPDEYLNAPQPTEV